MTTDMSAKSGESSHEAPDIPDAVTDVEIFDLSRPRSSGLLAAARVFDPEAAVGLVLAACLTSVFPEQRGDETFVERLRASITQNVAALQHLVSGQRSLDELELDDVLTFARLQAQLRIPQKSMQKSYRTSFYVQWQLWVGAFRSTLDSRARTEQEPASTSIDDLVGLTALVLSYQDHVASLVAETYTRDYDALNRSRAHVRRNLVQEVLRGSYDDLSATDLAILAYPLDAHHVAVLLPGVVESRATRIADVLRRACGANQSIVHPLTLSDCVIWLARYEPWRSTAGQEIGSGLREAGVAGAVSVPGSGAEGFRRTLAQARDADRIRQAWQSRGIDLGHDPVHYEDVRLEVLLNRDPETAHAFVIGELGLLAEATSEAARLRETLEASFRHGSHVAAAESLGLHEHTIRNRLQRAEQLLGHGLADRRTEVQVALRLVRMLG